MGKWQQLRDKIEEIRRPVEGTFGVAVKELATGDEIHLDGDELYPLASVLKIPVLVELYRQVGKGMLDLKQRYELTDDIKSQGSGVLKEICAGASLTLWDYALLMIIISDNTGTDQVCKTIGIHNVDPTMRALGLSQTSVTADCFHLLCDAMKLDPTLPRAEILAMSRVRAQLLKQEEVDAYIRSRYLGPNVSTPREMNLLLEKLLQPGGTRSQSGELVLSPEGQAGVIDILQRQQLRQRIPHYLPRGTVVAHKTGTLAGVYNDCGIVYIGPPGKSEPVYLISLLSKGVIDQYAGPEVLARISRAVYDALIG